MLHNFGTVHPICMKIVASKVAQDSKEKSRESGVRGRKNAQNYRAKRTKKRPTPSGVSPAVCEINKQLAGNGFKFTDPCSLTMGSYI